MKTELKVVKGRVRYSLMVGENIYSGGTLPASAAERIVAEGEVTESKLPGFQICVDGEWNFEGKPKKEKKD